jgi:hypothetical protein
VVTDARVYEGRRLVRCTSVLKSSVFTTFHQFPNQPKTLLLRFIYLPLINHQFLLFYVPIPIPTNDSSAIHCMMFMYLIVNVPEDVVLRFDPIFDGVQELRASGQNPVAFVPRIVVPVALIYFYFIVVFTQIHTKKNRDQAGVCA